MQGDASRRLRKEHMQPCITPNNAGKSRQKPKPGKSRQGSRNASKRLGKEHTQPGVCFFYPTVSRMPLYIVFELKSSVISEMPNNNGKSTQKPKTGKPRQGSSTRHEHTSNRLGKEHMQSYMCFFYPAACLFIGFELTSQRN